MRGLSYAWCGDGKRVAAVFANKFPEEVRHILQEANRICENSFMFTDRWEMERTHEPVVFETKIDWQFKPCDDSEWTYAFNRHSFLTKLARAYAISDDEFYALHYMRLILDFIENAPLNDDTRKTAWRAIETGIRCENWLKSLQLIKNCKALPQELFSKLDESLRIHATELIDKHGDFQRLSNWGVLQNHGLFLAGVYFKNHDYLNISLRRLSDSLRLQILPDGVHWEQSPLYHCEVLHCFLDAVQVASRCDITLPDGFAKTVLEMSRALAQWCKPDGHIPMQSDSDDIDARDIISHAALIFNDGALKAYAGEQVSDDNLWSLGADAEQSYGNLKTQAEAPKSSALKFSGNYILRSESNYLHMHCGCLGSGHGHADLLHIDLFAYGEDILIDSGRYTYMDAPIRRRLKSAAAHNTVVVDGAEFTVSLDSWGYSPIAMPIKGEYYFTEKADFVSGGHMGYLRRDVLALRKIVFIKPDIYVLFDEFYAKGRHQYTQRFHFNNIGAVSLDGVGAHYLGKQARATVIPLGGASINLCDAPVSRCYNKLEQCKCLQADCFAEGFAGLVTAAATSPRGRALNVEAKLIPVTLTRTRETLLDSMAQAVQITRNGEAYTVICLHAEVISEVGLIEAGGFKGYGKVMLFSEREPDGICLAW